MSPFVTRTLTLDYSCHAEARRNPSTSRGCQPYDLRFLGVPTAWETRKAGVGKSRHQASSSVRRDYRGQCRSRGAVGAACRFNAAAAAPRCWDASYPREWRAGWRRQRLRRHALRSDHGHRWDHGDFARGDGADLSAVAEGRNSRPGPRPAAGGAPPAGRCSDPGPSEAHAKQFEATEAQRMTVATGILEQWQMPPENRPSATGSLALSLSTSRLTT